MRIYGDMEKGIKPFSKTTIERLKVAHEKLIVEYLVRTFSENVGWIAENELDQEKNIILKIYIHI